MYIHVCVLYIYIFKLVLPITSCAMGEAICYLAEISKNKLAKRKFGCKEVRYLLNYYDLQMHFTSLNIVAL